MTKIILSTVVACSLGVANLYAGAYNIDKSHSAINFKIGHMLVSSVSGSFPNFSGEIEIDKKTNTLVKLQGEIDILTVDTRNKDRDKHLLGDEYFDAENYPKGILKMTKFSKEKNGIKVEADLTLRGITKKVVLRGDLKGPVQNPMNKKEIFGLSLEGAINRKDFNIGKDTSGATMGEEVEISINLELTAK